MVLGGELSVVAASPGPAAGSTGENWSQNSSSVALRLVVHGG
jgi:hypothetical protein